MCLRNSRSSQYAFHVPESSRPWRKWSALQPTRSGNARLVPAIRGISGGGLPWEIDRGVGSLGSDGRLDDRADGRAPDPAAEQHPLALDRALVRPHAVNAAVAPYLAEFPRANGPALGQGGVALVEEVGDVLEGQRLGERRRRGGVDGHDPDGAGPDGGHQLGQRRQVEDVAQALPVGLQQDREVAVLRRHRQQVGGPLALLPQRRAGTGPAAGQEQGAGRVLPEAGREQGRVGQLADDQGLDLLGLQEDGVDRRRLVGLGQADDDALVAPHGLDLDVEAVPSPGLDGQRPRGVHLRAVRRVHHDPPVAELVDELTAGNKPYRFKITPHS